MKVEKVHNGIRYTFSNEDLEEGDEVYSIANGRCGENGWILHEIEFEELTTGFPNEPHTILNLFHSDYKPYEVRTDMGYGPRESYYKIIKKEHQIKKSDKMFATYVWEEII